MSEPEEIDRVVEHPIGCLFGLIVLGLAGFIVVAIFSVLLKFGIACFYWAINPTVIQ